MKNKNFKTEEKTESIENIRNSKNTDEKIKNLLKFGFVVLVTYILVSVTASFVSAGVTCGDRTGDGIEDDPVLMDKDGNIIKIYPKNGDADGDGKDDWLIFRLLDDEGNDIELWCLNHGPTGDFGYRYSIAGGGYVWIGGCFYYCGRNSFSAEKGPDGRWANCTIIWSNWDPKTGKDRHFHFDPITKNLTIQNTENATKDRPGKPVGQPKVVPAPTTFEELRELANVSVVEPAGPGEVYGSIREKKKEKQFVGIWAFVVASILLISFIVGWKTGNNLFYIFGCGVLMLGGVSYFFLPTSEVSTVIVDLAPHPVGVIPVTISPIKQIDLLLTNADKNKLLGNISAEKLALMRALDISLKHNLSEKTEIIETKLSDTTRREATDHRRKGNYKDAIKSVDESIAYNPNNPWAYVEGIINSEELGNHSGAVDYTKKLDKIELTRETVTNNFPVDNRTIGEYKDYAVTFNNNGTFIAKIAETIDDIDDAINAVKTGAEYLKEALVISETLDIVGVKDTPTKTVINNLGSANINLIGLATQAGDAHIGEEAINETDKLIAHNPEVFSNDTIVKFNINAGVFKAVVKVDYVSVKTYGRKALTIMPNSSGANNLVGACLAIQGGEKNVKAAQQYLKIAVELDPTNEVYQRNLKVVNDAIAKRVYEGINIDFGVRVRENLITCCFPDKCVKSTEKKCADIGGAVMECIPEMPSGADLVVPAAPAPQNFTLLSVSEASKRYPEWWKNLTDAVKNSLIVRDGWKYGERGRRCMEFADNLTEHLRSKGFNATFTVYWWENDTNPNNKFPGHALSDVYTPGGEKVFIEPQWAQRARDDCTLHNPSLPDHYLQNGTFIRYCSRSMDADGDGVVEARNGRHSRRFVPTDGNIMIEQYQSRQAARNAGVPGA